MVKDTEQSRDEEKRKMTYTERLNVLELLINILKEHEAKLDELVGRIERLLKEAEA